MRCSVIAILAKKRKRIQRINIIPRVMRKRMAVHGIVGSLVKNVSLSIMVHNRKKWRGGYTEQQNIFSYDTSEPKVNGSLNNQLQLFLYALFSLVPRRVVFGFYL